MRARCAPGVIHHEYYTMEGPRLRRRRRCARVGGRWGVAGEAAARAAASAFEHIAARAVQGALLTQNENTMVKGGRGGSKKKATSRSAKAGLQFPVGRVHRHIKLGCREEAAAAPRT